MNKRTDTAKDLGFHDPADYKEEIVIELPMFICQECGNEFPPKMSEGEITDLTCKCGWNGNAALEECTTDELLGR